MGTAAGHVLPGLLLLGLGAWHLVCGLRNQIRYPREYSARTWHPVGGLAGRLRHLELYLLLALLPLAVVFELTVSTHFHPLVEGAIPSNRVTSFQHAVLLLLFWVWAGVTLLAETTALLPQPGGTAASFLLAGVGFSLEVLALGSQIAQMSGMELPARGLESRCYWLLACVAAVCAASSLLLAWRSKAALLEVILSAGLMLQGSWLLHTGLSLYVDAFIPAGCARLDHLPSGVDASTQCVLLDSVLRAMALMDLAFSVHVILLVLVCVLAYGILSKLQGERRGYDAITSVPDHTDQVQMKPLPKLAQF